ncbi:MAG: hypothetical protein AAGA65_04890 [Actinomycetota bacterium]
MAPKAAAPLWPVAVARILIGILWLFSLRWKLPPSFDGGAERSVEEWLDLMAEHAAFGFYGDLIESVVIPNLTLFSWLLFLTELAVGLSLLLGYRVPVGGLIGLGLSLNLGIGLLEVPGEWPWSYAMLAMWHGVFVVTDAGRVWGLDGRREDRPGEHQPDRPHEQPLERKSAHQPEHEVQS